jgi:hypothetical protein
MFSVRGPWRSIIRGMEDHLEQLSSEVPGEQQCGQKS